MSRVCLNALRARAARPETLAGPRIPDPVLSPADGPTPEQEALLADSVGLALLVVLDTLAPAERVAFVLHDVFDVPFAEIGAMLGRSTDATRQLASRARRRVREAGATEPDAAVAAQRAVAKNASTTEFHSVLVNGAVGMLITLNGRPAALIAFTIINGRIAAADGITDPHRVRKLVG